MLLPVIIFQDVHDIHVSHLTYPFILQWMFRWISYPGFANGAAMNVGVEVKSKVT